MAPEDQRGQLRLLRLWHPSGQDRPGDRADLLGLWLPSRLASLERPEGLQDRLDRLDRLDPSHQSLRRSLWLLEAL